MNPILASLILVARAARRHGRRTLALAAGVMLAGCGELITPETAAVRTVEVSPSDPPAAGVVPDGGDGWRAVAVGRSHTCAVDVDDVAWCWGMNASEQLGTASDSVPCGPPAFACRRTPGRVRGGLRFASVSAGASHSCGVTRDGIAYCWGSNDVGQLGVTAPRIASEPVPVTGALRWRAVEAGLDHTCGLTVDGALYCWGLNDFGQIAQPLTTHILLVPARANTGVRFAELSVGPRRACATTADGVVHCWGFIWLYARGSTDFGTLASSPIRLDATSALRGVSVGVLTNCAMRDDRSATCWGSNQFAQRGDGTTEGDAVPRPVRIDAAFRSVSSGSIQMCGVLLDRRGVCWGNNSFGQIGTPVSEECLGLACARSPVVVSSQLRFVELRTGMGNHVCGITTLTNLYCWGLGTNGQLGLGAREVVIRRAPERVASRAAGPVASAVSSR